MVHNVNANEGNNGTIYMNKMLVPPSPSKQSIEKAA